MQDTGGHDCEFDENENSSKDEMKKIQNWEIKKKKWLKMAIMA